jgi:hypothetical protein
VATLETAAQEHADVVGGLEGLVAQQKQQLKELRMALGQSEQEAACCGGLQVRRWGRAWYEGGDERQQGLLPSPQVAACIIFTMTQSLPTGVCQKEAGRMNQAGKVLKLCPVTVSSISAAIREERIQPCNLYDSIRQQALL